MSTVDKLSEILIRRAHPGDALSIKLIEQETGISEWAEEDYRNKAKDSGWKLLLAESDGQVIGFIVARLITRNKSFNIRSQRKVASKTDVELSEMEICSFAVRNKWQRKGIGGLLFDELKNELVDLLPGRLVVELRESNYRAAEFYSHCGFKQIGKRNGYYRSPHENALVMEVLIPAN